MNQSFIITGSKADWPEVQYEVKAQHVHKDGTRFWNWQKDSLEDLRVLVRVDRKKT